jgi:hypothetical protein
MLGLSRLRQTASDAKSTVQGMQALVAAYWAAALGLSEQWIGEPIREKLGPREHGMANRAQADIVNTLVVVGATLLIGIVVFSQIQSSTPAPENEQLNNTSQSVLSTVASSFDLGSILPIVIIAGAILAYLSGFGSMGGGGRGR